MNRRRFLAVSAAALAVPGAALAIPNRWRGMALGAKAEIVLHGPKDAARGAFAEIERLLQDVERSFSLYNPASELSRLNATGSLEMSTWFAEMFAMSDRLHQITEGLFDPSVQPVWRALFEGRSPPFEAIGWDRVKVDARRVTLGAGQALTFNGIAQGFATDLVAKALRARGFSDVLVNVGEFAGYGAPWRIGLSDPVHAYLGSRVLSDGAIATSSPRAMTRGDQGHILHPRQQTPYWSTVSVEAENAALADGLSTALCLADTSHIRRILGQIDGVRRVTTVDSAGNLRTHR